MSTWRRKSIALFPEHRVEFERATSVAQVLSRLSIDARAPHEAYALDPDNASARGYLQRLHGFAEWTLHQPELWAEAAIGFYEDLFALVRWEWITPWLSPFALDQIRQTWALGISGEHASKLDRILQEQTDHSYWSHVYATGEIDNL